jgi:glycosyltransferase involved in cell wall biosynthesis
MHNVLFITYFWPPSGKATLHWPLYIIKHLPKNGWQPSVLPVDEDTFSYQDPSLLHEVDPNMLVVKTPAMEPFSLYRKFLGKESGTPLISSETISKTNTGLRHRIALWIRMNLFVPDARRGWMWTAIRGGESLFRSKKIDAIITIGPPHSTHLIGRKLAHRHHIPHVPVLIDPWIDIAYYRDFKRHPLSVALDRRYEKSVVTEAAHVVFVTDTTRQDFIRKYPSIKSRSSVLYWGYNEENFSGIERTSGNAKEYVILHAGNIFDYQNPPGLWKAIAHERAQGRRLRLRFIGTVSPGIRAAIEEAGLSDVAEIGGFLPYHKAVREICSASYLLVCASEKRHVPGKLFEYIRSGRRIIAFGNDNQEVENILQKTNSGILFPYSYHKTDIFERVDSTAPSPERAEEYSREKIASSLATILNQLVTTSSPGSITN